MSFISPIFRSDSVPNTTLRKAEHCYSLNESATAHLEIESTTTLCLIMSRPTPVPNLNSASRRNKKSSKKPLLSVEVNLE